MKTIIIADIRGHLANGKIAGHIIPVARNYKELLGDDYTIRIAAGPAILNSFDKEDCIVLPYNICSEKIIDKLHTFVNFIVLLLKSHRNPIVLQQSSVVTAFIAIALFSWWTNKIYLIQYDTFALNPHCRGRFY